LNQLNQRDRHEAIAFFCQLVRHDPSPKVRVRTANALGKIGQDSENAIKVLFEVALMDSDDNVRASAISAITEIYITQPSDPLIDTLNQLIQILKLMIDKPEVQMNFNAPVSGVAGNVQGNMPVDTSEQNLAELSTEVQRLLTQLKQIDSIDSKDAELAIQKEIQLNPTLRNRLRNALKEGGLETVKVLFAPLGIAIETLRGWIEAD
jgi:hypothetical protein